MRRPPRLIALAKLSPWVPDSQAHSASQTWHFQTELWARLLAPPYSTIPHWQGNHCSSLRVFPRLQEPSLPWYKVLSLLHFSQRYTKRSTPNLRTYSCFLPLPSWFISNPSGNCIKSSSNHHLNLSTFLYLCHHHSSLQPSLSLVSMNQ